MQPSVSIILPTYNHGAFLKATINKILRLNYKNFELIIINDGSTDDTAQILSVVRDERVRIFNNSNHGVSFSRNFGLDIAKGEYVWFVDDDDDFDIDILNLSVNKIISDGSDLVMFGVKEINEDGKIFGQRLFNNYENVSNKDLVVSDFSRLAVNKVYTRKIIGQTRFNLSQAFGEDYTFFLDILLKKPLVSVINIALYSYVVTHSTSASKRFDVNRINTIELQRNKVIEILKENDINPVDRDQILLRFDCNAQNNSVGNIFASRSKISFFEKVKRINEIKRKFSVPLSKVIGAPGKRAMKLKSVVLALPTVLGVISFEFMYYILLKKGRR
ncbi:glycosyltransferase family 2 protein [Pediococcus acidilactici]|uniref:glycosyltransferase family 2 protein n=1 Tax=Pediococcus acidilactici TaxID=1254 RepID=UPI000E5D7385|nr:glycosyltransferase family A protein [Pediococcus acidilactici]RJF47245.1 glycosyltransferase family 2 protein [Pediococcus acidilactici]